jgi:hypothetical protein
MLDKDFIFKIAEEKIDKFKNSNIESLDHPLDLVCTWIQEDKTNIRKNCLIDELNRKIMFLPENIKDQKLYIKKLFLNSIVQTLQFDLIFMYPKNQFKYFLRKDLTSHQIDRFLLYLIRHEELTKREKITSEKTLENAHAIWDSFSLNHFLFWIFEELLMNLGELNKNFLNTHLKNTLNEIAAFIKVLDENGNIDQTKVSNLLKANMFLNKKFEDDFLK